MGARIIPYRGSWIDFEFDIKDIMYFRIDRKRKIPVTTLLKCLDYSQEEILTTFYNFTTYTFTHEKLISQFIPEKFIGKKLDYDIIDFETGAILIAKEQRTKK